MLGSGLNSIQTSYKAIDHYLIGYNSIKMYQNVEHNMLQPTKKKRQLNLNYFIKYLQITLQL